METLILEKQKNYDVYFDRCRGCSTGHRCGWDCWFITNELGEQSKESE